MKKILVFLCSLGVFLASFSGVISVLGEQDTFADDLTDLSMIDSKTGDWDLFPEHPEMGLSVAGRQTVSSETSLTYAFSDKAITELEILVAEYSGFFSDSDYKISAYAPGGWQEVTATHSGESNITGKESLNFKWMTLTVPSLPGNTTKIKITLLNPVTWTLFLDKITMTFGSLTEIGGGDENTKFHDDLSSRDNVTMSTGNWVSYESHPEFGCSVTGRADTESDNILYYTFVDGEITAFEIELAEYSGFLSASDYELAVRADHSAEWSVVVVAQSVESDIEGFETAGFKHCTLRADDVTAGMHQLRIVLKNPVAWTLFLDSITVYGVTQVDNNLPYNENLLSYTDENGVKFDYYLVTPKGYDADKSYPLVLFIHGIGGESDQSGYTYLRNKLYDNSYDCILLAPLADREQNQWWVDYKILSSESSIYNQDAFEATMTFNAAYNLLCTVEDTYSVDASRVYLIGTSMGAFASWQYLTRYPESFSAAVPICGGCDPNKASLVTDIPIWTFHGNNDEVVSVNAPRAMVAAIKAAGGEQIKYTEYEGLDHGIWFGVFDEPEMLPWLFGQKRQTSIEKITGNQEQIGNAVFYDPLDNFELVSSHTQGWDLFNPHPETGLSVIGRKNQTDSAAIYYTFDDKTIKNFSVGFQYAPGYADISQDFSAEIRTIGSDDWQTVKFSVGDITDIAGTSVFKKVSALSDSLPENTYEIRFVLTNETLWGLFLDEVLLNLQDNEVKNPEKNWNIKDDLIDYRYISEHSDNLQFFTPHPETGLNVLGKKNAKRGYVTYSFDGTINDFELIFQVAPEFFVQSRDLLIQIRLAGEKDFRTLSVLCGKPQGINDTFARMSVTPEMTLPAGVAELKIFMYNDVAWTLMLDDVNMNVSGILSPQTGDQMGVMFPVVIFFFLIAILAGGIFISIVMKERKGKK